MMMMMRRIPTMLVLNDVGKDLLKWRILRMAGGVMCSVLLMRMIIMTRMIMMMIMITKMMTF